MTRRYVLAGSASVLIVITAIAISRLDKGDEERASVGAPGTTAVTTTST